MRGDRYVGFYPAKWRNSLTRLSLQAEGLMIRMCAYRWDSGRLVPADPGEASRLLGVNHNQFRKCLRELLDAGEVRIDEEHVVNDRAEDSYAQAKRAIGTAGKDASTSRNTDPRQERQAGDNTVAPQATPVVTPRVTPGVTPQVTPQVTSERRHTPGVTPQVTPQVTPGVTPPVEAEKIQEKLRAGARASFRLDKQDTPKPPTGASHDMPDHVTAVRSWSAAFEPPADASAGGVVRTESGSILLLNGTRQLWLDQFGGDAGRLDLALIEIAGEINSGSRKPIAADVQARLARKAADKRDRDERYAAAAARNAAQRDKPKVVKPSRW